MTRDAQNRFVRWFSELSLDDIASVGGKNASLGEMSRELRAGGIPVPPGFAVTAEAYRHFLAERNLASRIREQLDGLDVEDSAELHRRGQNIRQMMIAESLPDDLRAAIIEAYRAMNPGGEGLDVAVRSSATAEDLPEASFAGQQETYLNIKGDEAVLDACRRCFASLFTDRAISYRHQMGFDPFAVELSVGVQRMVRSDVGSAGVMFSIDTETGFRNAVLINSSWGLGETVVQGSVNPDEFVVFKPTLKEGKRPILRKRLGAKEHKIVYDVGGGKMVKTVSVPRAERNQWTLSDDEILTLANWACRIEDHYSGKKGRLTPMDIEWAKDGNTGELFIVQARPETVQSRKEVNEIEVYKLSERGRVLAQGRSIGEKIAQGPARIIQDAKDLGRLQKGEVLVTDRTDPDWEPAMKRAAAVVTNRGGRTAHAAIVSRELGLAAIVGAGDATEAISDGQTVTVSCAEGDTGYIYDGAFPFDVERLTIENEFRPFTNIMMNVANPGEVFRLSQLPNDGVGLARLEFIINNEIGVHPMALLEPERVTDEKVREEIERRTVGYDEKPEFFVDQLTQGIAMIGGAFYPKDVIVRLSDFKTNEYANLLGGEPFEPKEENPMLGFRGASRYYHDHYRRGFALECEALRRVRDDMGLSNVKVMVPFCRTVEEGKKVLAEMEMNGLKRGENGLEVYVMCEIPVNVEMAEEFSEVFDGFSIGSNDLTQLILGVDRDSEMVAGLFDERNPAVKRMISRVIRTAKAKDRKIGICGQAPSDYPEFATFLVEEGIDSISLNPDVVLQTTRHVMAVEDVDHDR